MTINRARRQLVRAMTLVTLFAGVGVQAEGPTRPDPLKSAQEAQQRARVQAQQLQDSDQSAVTTRSIFEATPYQQPPMAPRSTADRVGQRQTAADLVPANRPVDRVDVRIETRVQSRIANRLDRYNALQPILSPFATAADQARVAAARRR